VSRGLEKYVTVRKVDDWETAFAEKSERRRKRSRQRHVIRHTALFVLIGAAILVGLWLVDMAASTFLFR
jgi:ferric-dicitrate binding protein FerR (iron transport regulator)